MKKSILLNLKKYYCDKYEQYKNYIDIYGSGYFYFMN